jgi:cell division protein FtsZ
VQGISDLMTVPGLINVDFADVRTIMSDMGRALMGSGSGTGSRRAVEAAEAAICSPLLEDVTIEGATGVLINITGGPDMTLHEVNEASSLIEEAAHEDANIIFGSVIDAHMGDEVRITVIATGFDRAEERLARKSGAVRRDKAQPGPSQIALPYDQAASPPRRTRVERQPEPEPEAAVSGEIVIDEDPVAAEVSDPNPVEVAATHDAAEGEPATIERALDDEETEPEPAETHWPAAEAHQELAMEADLPGAFAHGTGPTPQAMRGTTDTLPNGFTPDHLPRRKRTFPRVHPSLRHVLEESDLDEELDVPAFLRRHGHGTVE